MYLKRLLAFLCCFTLVFCLFPSSAFATGGNGNIDGGGGSMGHGTSSNFWNSGNDGVRITVVDASSGTAVSSPLDFSNRTQKTSLLHFGKVNKLQYLGGAGLSLQSGVAYSCIRPTQSMPTIVSSKGQSNIKAIKRYFCSEYACMMVAQAAGVDYERMIAGEYKLLIEPIAYFTHNGQYYCMTATEAGLYDQMSGGNLRKTMTSLTHKNLPLSMFLEFSDLGISAWTGSTTGKQNNSDIISTLGVGIVWFDEAPPEGEIEAPDVEYRVDTDVITAVTLRTDQDLTPDNPASVTFHILGTTYRVNDIVIPAGDSQVVWVKWHTPSTPQTVTITVSVSGAYTAQDTFVAKIVDLNEHIPPDPVATDTNPGYSVPPLPSKTQKLTANWGVWSCYWVPVWVWCDHGEDGGHWVDEGYWEYRNMPCIVRNMTDDEAILAMTDDNLRQRETILPSEKAMSLKMQYEAIKHQGARGDSAEAGKLSLESVGQRNGMSVKTVQRYIWLNDLVPELKQTMDDGKLSFTPAVEISRVRPKHQKYIAVSIEGQQASPSKGQAKRLRELDKENKLSPDVIDGILCEEKKKEDRDVIITGAELEKFFGKEATPRQMKDQIMMLLEDWKERQPPELAKPDKKMDMEK